MENLTDSQLIKLYIEGNHKAFESLVNRYGQILYRFIYNLLNNKEEAHEITQDTFIKIWKNIKKYEHDKNFKTWIFTIGKRTAIDYLRKNKDISFSKMNDNYDFSNNKETNTFEESIPDIEPLAEEIFEKNEKIEIVKKILEDIPIEDKIIILLKNGEEMTFEEIASILEKPMNTVKSQYRRALIFIKKEYTTILSQL
jgi:RNA polymerase sigma-70 factor (ECF subfamily)